MALVTFTDSQGTVWSVWDVARPIAEKASMDYLAGGEYQNGWLCFQPNLGDERRRLSDYPDNWMSLDAMELEKLCNCATPVVSRSSSNHRAVDSPRTETGGHPPFESGASGD